MPVFEYTPPANTAENFNKAVYGGTYFEVPGVFLPDGTLDVDANHQKVMDAVAYTSAMVTRSAHTIPIEMKQRGLQDKVFVDGQIVREDASLFYPQAQGYLATLQDAFPNSFVDYDGRQSNVLGAYDAYREPYQNPSISWYEFITPTTEVLSRYGIDAATFPVAIGRWYGLKHDLVTKEIWLKLVVGDLPFAMPELPAGHRFYAMTYHEDGTRNPLVDAYIITTPDFMRDYCDRHGLIFPVDGPITETISMWGVVFDADTLALSTVKAYYEYGDTAAF